VVTDAAPMSANVATTATAARERAGLLIRNIGANTSGGPGRSFASPPAFAAPGQLATGQPGVGAGSPRFVTKGAVQCSLRAISWAIFCHSVGLQP
jgi:hypothetical protein